MIRFCYRYDYVIGMLGRVSATLDIVALRSLVAVATYGGFHKAASALHLTQAAVSRHVQRLEDAFEGVHWPVSRQAGAVLPQGEDGLSCRLLFSRTVAFSG